MKFSKIIQALLAGSLCGGLMTSAQADEAIWLGEDVMGAEFVRSLPIGARESAIKVVTAPVFAGHTALQFELRPGDCSAGKHGWDDCAQDRERVELKQRGYISEGARISYEFAFYLEKDFADIWPAKLSVAQLHQNGGKPAVMILHRHGGLWLDIHHGPKTIELLPLISADELLGRWHKIKLVVNWSRRDDGAIAAYVNDKLVADYHGASMDKAQAYFKFGLYRSHLQRRPQPQLPVQRAYYDQVVIKQLLP